jgi:putative nucleotidyltransferase with HDIG domain
MTLFEGKDGRFQSLLQSVENSDISSIKTVVSGIIRIINDPRSTVKELKELIEMDPPLTARLLKIANSAFYSLQRKVGEIEQAIILIGFEELKELALNQKVCELFAKGGRIQEYSRPLLWKHSVAVALLSKMLYRKEFGLKGDNIYAAGLLHDLGIVIEDQFLHPQFAEILKLVHEGGKNLADVEASVLGFHHAEVGGALLDHWSFPSEFVFSIVYHHSSFEQPQDYTSMVLTLYVANYICQSRGIGYSDSPLLNTEAYRRCLNTIGVNDTSVDVIVEDLRKEMARIESRGFF